MNTMESANFETDVRNDLASLHPAKQYAIKEAYYKSVEGLARLANELETADLDIECPPEQVSTLLELHLKVCDAMVAFKSVDVLGKIL